MKRFGCFETFAFIITIAFLVTYKLSNRREIDRIFDNSEYAIGTVTEYLAEGSGYTGLRILVPRRSGFIVYYFYVNSQRIDGRLSGGIQEFPSKGEFLNKTFLVVYNKEDPNESQLMFDMPVSDSTDFKRYVVELETERRKK